MKCTHVLGLEMRYYYIVPNFKLLTQAQPYIPTPTVIMKCCGAHGISLEDGPLDIKNLLECVCFLYADNCNRKKNLPFLSGK